MCGGDSSPLGLVSLILRMHIAIDPTMVTIKSLNLITYHFVDALFVSFVTSLLNFMTAHRIARSYRSSGRQRDSRREISSWNVRMRILYFLRTCVSALSSHQCFFLPSLVGTVVCGCCSTQNTHHAPVFVAVSNPRRHPSCSYLPLLFHHHLNGSAFIDLPLLDHVFLHALFLFFFLPCACLPCAFTL